MSKNAEGWIRHRGGKCPVDGEIKVETRQRGGQIVIENAQDFWWEHRSNNGDIMAYRLHKPAEQGIYADDKGDFGEPVQVTYVDSDGPLQWRDRITEIDRTVEALEEERVALVQRLEGEGFRLIERINAGISDAMQAHEDMSNPKNWEVGDVFAQIAEGLWCRPNGTLWTMTHDDGTDMRRYMADTGTSKYVKDFALKFHSRPSK